VTDLALVPTLSLPDAPRAPNLRDASPPHAVRTLRSERVWRASGMYQRTHRNGIYSLIALQARSPAARVA
jgi:hypothetical protein